MLSDICEELVIGSQERPLDPLYVQPASLELATIRKKQGEELVSNGKRQYIEGKFSREVILTKKNMSPISVVLFLVQ